MKNTNEGLVQEGKAKVLKKVILNDLFEKRAKRWHSNILDNVDVELSITVY